MSIPLFDKGIQGLSDSLWSGAKGSCSKLVGIDYRSTPGTFKAHQKLSKHSGTTIDQLCKNVVNCSDGSRIWFSSESGKIWREVSGTYTLVHTTVPTSGEAKCLGAMEYFDEIYWATEKYLHKISINDFDDWTQVYENAEEFHYGDTEFHPMTIQNLSLYIGDKRTVAKIKKENIDKELTQKFTTTFGGASTGGMIAMAFLTSSERYPKEIAKNRTSVETDTAISHVLGIPNATNKVLMIALSTVRTDSNYSTMPTTISVGSKEATQVTGANFDRNMGGTDRMRCVIYKLINPDSGSQTVTATFAGTETNMVMTSYVVRDSSDVSASPYIYTIGFNGVSSVASFLNDPLPAYSLPVCFVQTGTTTHSKSSAETTVYNNSNFYGRDSMSIIDASPDITYTAKSEFNLVSPERIQTIKDFDIDILVGTRAVNKGRVLRWDGISEGWSAQDDIDEQGINAFIRDDNFMYVQAGFYGRLYFYNGEKLDPYQRIPGEWSPSKTAKINPNATAFHLGVPVFGLTNVAGNPALQGIYGFGSYGMGYDKTLSLDFPIPTNAFSGVEIGAIVSDGADLYTSYKDGTDVGIAKLDWTAKYTAPYLETVALISPENRSDFTNIQGMSADYVDLPANTDITFSYKKNYDSSFTALSSTYLPKLKQVKARESITDISNLIVKVALTTSANATPQIENISIDI